MNVTDVLVDILAVLLAAKIAAEAAERLRIPAVVGEILAGIVIGPSVFGLVGSTEVLAVLGQLGVILLLLDVGLELSLGDLAAVGRASLTVATVGVILPTAAGFGVALAFQHSNTTALFIGAALAATSVGITARVFSDLGALTRVEARTVLGAAVADDVIGLVLLTIVVRLATAASVSALDLAGIIAIALVFLVAAVALGTRFGPGLFERVDRHARSPGTFVAIALAFTLVFAALADAAQLAPIVGAFAAGVALSGSGPAERVRRELKPVGHLFVPVFFLQIGVEADLDVFTHPELLALIACLLAVAILGKVVAGTGILAAPGDKLLVGLGMLPRGEVGLIFASIGLADGVLNADLYGALVAVVLGTTLLAPPMLRWRLGRLRRQQRHRPAASAPPGGWLRVNGEVVLVAEPPDEDVLVVALDAALLVARAPPSAALLDWLGRADPAVAQWDGRATTRLLAILRDGGVRSWRFLEAAGVLERALPELAAALRKRRADPFLLDPAHVLQFDLVEAVRDLVHHDPRAAAAFERLRHPERPLLAALVIAAAGDASSDPVELTRQLAQRLRLGGTAQEELVRLVDDRALLRAAATRIDGLDEEPVLQLATHLDTPERSRALYMLALALGELEPWQRDRLDELLSRILSVQARPDLTGHPAGNAVEQRRRETLAMVGEASTAADWIRTAPRAYVLTTPAADVARHAGLLEPLPRRGAVRLTISPLDNRLWRAEIVARDRPGLIAAVSGVLAAHGLDVVNATIATWPNGAALQSFRVSGALRADELPDAAALTTEIESALDAPPSSPPQPDLDVSYDDDSSPWYTLCEIRGRDRRGLLHAVSIGFAATGVSVHSARVETRIDVAIDRFEVSDVNGRKLGEEHKRAVVAAIHGGVQQATTGRRRRGRRQFRTTAPVRDV